MKKAFKNVKGYVGFALAALLLASCGETTTTTGTTSTSTSEYDDYRDPRVYTYHESLSASPDTWNVHSWKYSTSLEVFGNTEIGLYDFALDDDLLGYKIVPEMASGAPVDVTSQLTPDQIEEYGLATKGDGEAYTAGQVWQINLNKAAVWQDGTTINAQTYVDSMDRLLDPNMANFRADSWYSGDVVLGNAEGRFKSGRTTYGSYTDEDGEIIGQANRISDGLFASPYFVSDFLGYSIADLVDTYGANLDGPAEDLVDDTDTWGTSDNPTWVDVSLPANADALTAYVAALNDCLQNLFGDYAVTTNLDPESTTSNTTWSAAFFVAVDLANPTVKFDQVGIKKTGDYQITLFLRKPCSTFQLYTQLSSNWIVKKDIYDANKQTIGNLTATTYGTSVATYSSYGPYKLTEFTLDKKLVLSRNDKWYGYSDGNHYHEFQTDAISIDIVPSDDTVLSMFEKGELDSVSVRAQDMSKYGKSSQLIFTPQSYTDKIALNSGFNKLVQRQTAQNETAAAGVHYNQTIMANKEFRKALSWALDRETFVQTQTPGSAVALGVINYMYVADPDSGTLYRDTEPAKRVISDIYEDSETGFNLAYARSLIQEALTAENAKAVANPTGGFYQTGDTVELTWDVYNEGWEPLIKATIDYFTAATVGTALEGKFTIKINFNVNLDVAAKGGNTNFVMDNWGGSQMDPYGIPDTWIDSENRTCYGFNPDSETITITIDGVEITKTNTDWYNELTSGDYSASEVDYETRCLVLSYLEEYMLQQQYFIAVRARQSVSMDSFRLIEGTDEYQQLVAFGGIRKLRYSQDDVTWAATAAKGLDYTK
mgnify:CR=1 FL=1